MNAQDIRKIAKDYADEASNAVDSLHKDYWVLQAQISSATYISRWEQIEAIGKLSQLGLALQAAAKYYSAINLARCN